MNELTWLRLRSGNYGAADEHGRFYLVGKQPEGGWFAESWPEDDPSSHATTTSYGYRTMTAARAEVAEQATVAELLNGKYGVPFGEAHEALALARKQGSYLVASMRGPVVIVPDAGGYTLAQSDEPPAQPCSTPALHATGRCACTTWTWRDPAEVTS